MSTASRNRLLPGTLQSPACPSSSPPPFPIPKVTSVQNFMFLFCFSLSLHHFCMAPLKHIDPFSPFLNFMYMESCCLLLWLGSFLQHCFWESAMRLMPAVAPDSRSVLREFQSASTVTCLISCQWTFRLFPVFLLLQTVIVWYSFYVSWCTYARVSPERIPRSGVARVWASSAAPGDDKLFSRHWY